MIRLYCVGIHFRKQIKFVADMPDPKGSDPSTPVFMSGQSILQAAGQLGLRYRLTVGPPVSPIKGHVAYVSYSPVTPPLPEDLPYRITDGGEFPFYGQPLSQTEILAPIGQISQVLQYTVTPIVPIAGFDDSSPPPPIPFPVHLARLTGDPSDPKDPLGTGSAQFGSNGFPDHCEIRIRLLGIFCTT